MGHGAPHISKVRAYLKHIHNACLHSSVPTLSGLILRADLAIGAGGSTSWERACLGLPSLVFSVSPNQIDGSNALHNAGAAVHFDCPPPQLRVKIIRDAVSQFCKSNSDLSSMSLNSKRICDGKGLIRVSNAILGPLGPYSLSPASLSDCDLYFNWANDTQVRLQSINNKSISYPEHLKWFRNTLASPLVLMFILKDRYSFLCQIRFPVITSTLQG